MKYTLSQKEETEKLSKNITYWPPITAHSSGQMSYVLLEE